VSVTDPKGASWIDFDDASRRKPSTPNIVSYQIQHLFHSQHHVQPIVIFLKTRRPVPNRAAAAKHQARYSLEGGRVREGLYGFVLTPCLFLSLVRQPYATPEQGEKLLTNLCLHRGRNLGGTTLLASFSGPIEVRIRDELLDRATLEVSHRPLDSVAGKNDY
jgi:hypothetical protein